MEKVFMDVNIARIGDFVDEHLARVLFLPGDVPPFSSLEFSINGACNRRCIFCPRVDPERFPNKYESISLDVFKKTMRELATIHYSGRMSFSGFSEPLLTKNLEEYLACGRATCPEMTIEMVSNGDALTLERLKSLFASGLDNIRLSLYDGPHQDEKFFKMKEAAQLNDKQFIIRQRYLSVEETYGLTISNRAGAVNLINDKIEVKALQEPLHQPCHYPFYKMMVDYDGAVFICSNDWLRERVVGNLKDQTVFEIWNSEEFNCARKNLISNNRSFAPCKKCDVNGLYNGMPHFKAWVQYYQYKNK